MVETLRARWRVSLAFEEMIALRDQLDSMLHQIHSDRHIRPPVIRCARCGHVGESAEPDVSVRALILSLGRFGIAPAEEIKILEKSWDAYRKQRALDLYGKPEGTARASSGTCSHLNAR